jgi:NADH-quinone oxidoreductase subunit C
VKEIAAILPDVVLDALEFAGQVTVTVPRERIAEVGRVCKERLDYKFLVDVTAVDWKERPEGRFDVVYWMHRFADSKRLRLKIKVADGVEVPSVTAVWKVANWMEREAFDMFGIYFADHPNLERILTWEGFSGHPLRKDFPIEGIDTGAAIYPDVYPPGGGPVTGGGGD